MADNLENIWSEDPPRREQSDKAERTPLNLWEEPDTDSPTESTHTTEEAPEGAEFLKLWSRPPPPAPTSPPTADAQPVTFPPSTSEPPDNGQPQTSTHERAQRAKLRQAKKRRRAVLLAGSVLLLVLIVDGAWATFTLVNGLRSTESELQAGISSLQAGDFSEARDHFNQARDEAGSAEDGLNHPSMLLASLTPVVDRDVDVVRSLSGAGQIAAESGVTVVDLAEALGVTDDGFASTLYADGRVNLEALDQGRPQLQELSAGLSEAEALLEEAPEASLGLLDVAHETALGEISGARETARKSSEMFGALPTLLGQDTEQRYFLAFQTLSEARGTGGLVGLYGVLSASDGAIELKEVAPIGNLLAIPFEPVSGPDWFAKRYKPFGSFEQWQQVNMSPNLPAVSEVFLDMYEAARGERLDGVVAMDPIALGMISRGTGPLRAEGLDVAITEANAGEVLLRSIYEEFPGENAQNSYLTNLITEFWGRIQQGDVNGGRLVSGLGEAVTNRHFSVYSADAEAQDALVVTEAAGNYDSFGPNVQMVFHDNLGANKVDYFLERRVDTRIEIEEGGEATVTTSIKVKNDSLNEPVLVEGPIKSDPPNRNRMFLNAILPQNAQVQSLTVDEKTRPEIPDNEDGFPAVWDVVVVDSGQSAEMVVEYRLPNAFNTSADNGTFDMTLIPQARVTPDEFSLEVTPPDGFSAAIEDADGAGESGTSVSGELDSVRTYRIELIER